MSSYGELIQALRVLKNVKEKRHGIKTLASLCSNRAFQVRIVQRGGWRTAILPLIISLDEDCRMYAALAVANLSTSAATHPQLLEEEVLRHLVPILQSEEVQEVIAYVLNALGNFACSEIMWHELQQMNAADGILTILKQTQREEIRINCLFCLANLTADPWHRKWMMGKEVYEIIWSYMQDPNYTIMSYSLAILRGLAVETEAQELFPSMGLVPLLIGIYHSQCPQSLKTLSMDLLLHFSMFKQNAGLMMEKEVAQVIELAGRGTGHVEYVPIGIAIIANICESVDLHDRIVESPLFEVLTEHIHNDNTNVQTHVIRALMQLSLSPKYHHVILTTGAMANVCPIALTQRLSIGMRTNALQMMAAVCATHPTTPTTSDIIDLMFLIVNSEENIDIRRAAALVIANASSDSGNLSKLASKPYLESLSIAVSKSQDPVLVDYLMQFFHNIVKLDGKSGSMLMACGFHRHIFNYERLESLSVVSAIYLCDLCRQVANTDAVVRATLLEEMIFSVLTDAWVVYLEDPRLAPHLALMCSSFCYHADSHQEFVLQGGVRLVIQMYSKSKVEHVRLCCLLCLLYLAESGSSQRAIAQEKGVKMLLTACENETHIDLIVNALKALIPFACSDEFRPQLGMDGALDTFSAFMFSDQLQLQQLGIYLLQNLLEFRENRRIFLGFSDEKKCEEDYLESLLRLLPRVSTGQPQRIKAMKKTKEKNEPEVILSDHDPFVCRCCIHCIALLSLEHNLTSFQRFVDLTLPKLLFDLFYSEQIDKSSGEAVVLFFANILHSSKQIQAQIMKGADIVQLLLSSRDMLFSPHTISRCLSALLCIARIPDFKRVVLSHLDLLMADINANLNMEERDEHFYQIAALQCSLLSELARASYEYHEQMAKSGIVEALLVFITMAGKDLNDKVCVELLMGAVFGIAALVGSPTGGDHSMASLIYPATRLQLLLSLLRLPQQDVNEAFHSGTVGLRTLQRVIYPNITTEELHVDSMDILSFLGNCAIKPANFIYRNVIRTVCLLLSHHEMGPRVQQALEPSNVVPTCLFAMKDCEDTYVQVYGFLLVANFSRDRALLYNFLNESAVINELLTTIRRSAPHANAPEATLPVRETLSNVTGPWSSSAVARNRYMLAMSALTNFAERVKEKFRGDDGEIPVNPDMKDDGGLVISNRITLNKLTSTCMRELDTIAMEKKLGELTPSEEFIAMLRVLICANNFMARVELEDPGRGGEVKLEAMDSSYVSLLTEAEKSKDSLVLQALRHDFRTLGMLHSKTQGMLEVVKLSLNQGQASSLVAAVVECLTGLTFLSPLSIRAPLVAYRISLGCPEWLQPSLMALIANALADPARINQFEEDEPECMLRARSDHLFPMLATSTLEIRQKVLGVLANAAAQDELLEFIVNSGVFRICKGIPGKGWFVEHFALMIELTRMLANLTCRQNTHKAVMTPDTMAFLRDVLRHCAVLFHRVKLKTDSKDEDKFDYYEVVFEPEDAPPLGLRIGWELPPQLSKVLPNRSAARVCTELRPGDELVEVNGTDVTELEQGDIEPMFEARPLKLLFRRRPEPSKEKQEEGMRVVGNIRIEQVQKVAAYGDPAQYLECFNLAVLVIHNLAVEAKNLELLHSEPRILRVLLEVMPADATSPSLRRLIFSTLTCLCQEKAVSGRIFHAMAEYFQNCQKTDSSLHKYIMCCANLYYTSMSREEVKPDRGMLMFVSRMSAEDDALVARRALIEIFHGMSQAPSELRRKFLSREILVLACSYLENPSPEIQIRAYESMYFCTLGACAPDLWSDLDILGRMVRTAGVAQAHADENAEDLLLRKHADALWEISLRALHHCLQYEVLVRQMRIPDLDRYLMELLVDGRKPPELHKVAADLIAGLLQSSISGNLWTRWRGLGVGERLVGWFKVHGKKILESRMDAAQRLSAAESLDAMLHMVLFAVEVDSSMVVALVAEDVLGCIAHRLEELAAGYERWNDMAGGHKLTEDLEAERAWMRAEGEGATAGPRPSADEVARADASFRIIAQLLTALVANEHGLSAMSALNLETPLVALLELPTATLRVPVMLVLCAMSSNQASCQVLMKSEKFLGVLRRMEKKLGTVGEAPPVKDEVEYLVCILDRSCCHPELAKIAQEQLFRLLCVLPSRAETLAARLMALRALSRCSFVAPECMNDFGVEGVACLQYIMAVSSCLSLGRSEKAEKAAVRRRLIQEVKESLAAHPALAPLVEHLSRTILCEAVSVSRTCCHGAYEQLDLLGMLKDLQDSFEEAVADFDKLEGNKLEATAAELMNKLVALLHVLLCSMFRHGRPPHAYSKDPEEAKEKANGGFTDADVKPAVEGLMQVLDKVQALLLLGGTDQTGEQKPGSTYLADLLASDIRVLFYLTALLREASCKPLESPFLRVTRSTAYFDTLSACINLALKRFQRESKGPPPRDLCAKKGGPTDSPVSQHMDDFDLGLIFEHLIVCLRHTLVQAMYVAPEVSTKLLPWAWISQERLLMHREVMTWLPQIVKRYKEVSAIRTETLRYFACAASYECAPFARPEDAAFEIEDEKAAAGAPGAAVADDPTLGRMQVDADAAAAAAVADAAEAAAAEAAVATAVAEAGGVPTVGESEASEQGIRRPFGGLVSLRQSELRNFLAEELERSNDMYALCLSMLCVANFAAYERPGTTPGAGGHGTRKLGKHLPVEEMSRLLRGVIRVVKAIPTFEDVDVANTMTLHALRFICNLLAFEVDFITAELQHLNFLEEASKLFEYWFHDEDKIEDDKLYIQTLQSFILLLRNWSCGSCRAETKVRERKENASSKEERDSAGSLLKVFKSGINVPYLITLTMRFSKVLISGRRSVPNKEEEREKVIGDVLVILQTLLKRTDSLQNMNWEKVDIIDYENFLHIIKIHRLKTSDILEDEQILNTLYLMVKQAFPFKGLVFLEYLMEVAYGDHREEHTTLQDMAAVCCAIISTQNATDASTPTVNVASVVKDNAAFVHALERVPDPKMQIWHYRLLTGWSRRPKALDDLVGDTEALRFVVEHLLETHLCRYSVVIVHNISMLRSSALLTCPGHLSTICEAYRQLGPGATLHRGDEKQRRLVRRLLLAAVRNCLWNSSNVQKELHEDDMLNIINLVSCIEEADLPFFMAVILYISEGCEINRVREAMYGNAQLLELMVRCMYQQATACVVDLEEENKYESSMYGLITEEEAQRAERYDALMEHSEAIANAPKKQTEAYKKLLAIPGSPAARGLGKTASLYQRSRRKGTHPAAGVRGEVTMNTTGTASRKLSEVEERRGQQEFLYFAAVELLTYGTFAGDDHDRRFPPPPTAEPHRAEVAEALHKAFQRFTLQNFLKILAEQIQQHKKMKVVLSDMFMHVSTKFLWHCWTQPIFTGYVNTAQNLEILAQLVPFMISWPNHDVQMMIGDVCLYAGLHRFPAVCDILIAEYRDYPELSCAMLTRCMISPVEETGLRPKQAVNFLKIFVCLLRDRALSHTGLKRLAIGLETALLMDSPKGLCGILAQREYELLADLLEALSTFQESAAVKQCMVVALTRTVGKHYKALPELDDFLLRILDMSIPLLDAEFTLYMPVLYKLAIEGGRRVQGPMLSRQIHLRVARLLEQAVAGLESDVMKIEGYNDEDEDQPVMGPKLDSRGRMQWCLAFLTALATVQVKEAPKSDVFLEKATDIQFDSFVCVDLLPMLVRILRQSPEPFEALAVCFLLSSVSTSPCLPPHMPDVLRISEKAFPTLLAPDAPARDTMMMGEEPGEEKRGWNHLKIPPQSRIDAGIRRCFIHLLSRAAHVPKGNACLLNSHSAWHFLTGLESDPELYGDQGACIHAKTYALAFLLQRFDDHKLMIELGLMERLLEAKAQIKEEMQTRFEQPDLPDLRLPWIHCIISLVTLSGPKLFNGAKGKEFEELIAGALDFANDLQFEGRMKIQRGMSGLVLDLECQQALGAALAPLSTKAVQFNVLKPKFTLYLLALVCSAPTVGLRKGACDYLSEMLQKGTQSYLAGAAFLKANCLQAFRRILTGPLDDLAASTSRMMIALSKSCYGVHVHMLDILETVLAAIGNPASGSLRVISLSELFVALSDQRTVEVLGGIIELPNIMAFLGLARSSVAARRELVQKWLENFGSSLYELDEVSESFAKSTLEGLLYVSSRSTLDPDEATDFRKALFSLILKRVETWRNSYFGPYEFLSETVMSSLVPMCEMQPDLCGALVALFHSFITHGETRLLERVWAGGFVPWLCKRLGDKSKIQLAMAEREPLVVEGGSKEIPRDVPHQVAKGWDRHKDMVSMQAMVVRIVTELYNLFPADFGAAVAKEESLVRNLREHVTFYCQQTDWPMKEDKEVTDAVEAIMCYEMQLALRLVYDINEDLQRLLVQQGLLGVCCTILLPTPKRQQEMRAAIGEERSDEDFSETLTLQEAKLLAGAVASRLLSLPDAYKYIQDRRARVHALGMFSQIHHWSDAVFEQQGSIAELSTVTLLERQSTLYMAMLSCETLDWCLENLGLGQMDVFTPIWLRLWASHPNVVIKHHAMRLFSNFCQVHCLFASVLQAESRAKLANEAIHRTFGFWDVRELRHLLRLMVAVLCHVLSIPTCNVHFSALVARMLARKLDCPKLAETLRLGAAPRASSFASKYMFRTGYLQQILSWCEKPGDHYSRAWGLWLVLTMLSYEASEEKLKAQADTLDPEAVLVMEEVSLEEVQVERRNRLLDEQEAAAGKSSAEIQEMRSKQPECKTRIHWLRSSRELIRACALSAGKCISYQWKDSQQLGCVASAWCLVELPEFIQTAVESIDSKVVSKCLTLPEKSLQLAALLLVSVVSSLRLQLNARNIAAEFLRRFHHMQQILIESLSSSGEGPYDMIARWLHEPMMGLPNENEFRCLVSFMIGQCICPPLASTPSLDLESSLAAPGKSLVPVREPLPPVDPKARKAVEQVVEAEPLGAPPVAECGTPPAALLDKIAEEVMKEDQRLLDAQGGKMEGPMYSTMLCHLLFALAVMVPSHPKEAAQSSRVRGAAFAQLIKVQQIVAQGILPKALYDPADGDRAKLFLYVRATACVRSALQTIMASWFAADFGARFVISEEGGKDFIQYCCKHINQAYNHKTALTKVLGSPWERVMLSQGPTATIAELLVVVCSSDANLVESSKLGGEQALHSLSRFGDSAQIRQQATMLLTKLAVVLKK